MAKLAFLLVLCLGVDQILAAKRKIDDFDGLADALTQYIEEDPDEVRRVSVDINQQEVSAHVGALVQLPCNYKISGKSDLPVTVTWKVGDGPRNAKGVFQCKGYTHTANSCTSQKVLNEDFEDRVRLAKNSPSLEITQVNSADSRNFWCQVSLDRSSDIEMGFDMKSIVLRVYQGNYKPKFNLVKVAEDAEANTGGSVTLDCSCSGPYSHCDDVVWYKGPTDATYSNYDLVYSKETFSRPTEPKNKAYNEWIGRATLSGSSLTINEVTKADSGRYWCEVRAAQYIGIGEWATDAASVVLEVL